MSAFLVSLVAVAIAEIGDKTQLLAFLLEREQDRWGPVSFPRYGAGEPVTALPVVTARANARRSVISPGTIGRP